MNHSAFNQATAAIRRHAAVDRAEPLSVLPLTVRLRARLLGAGIDTVGKLAAASGDDIMALPNVGEGSLAKVHRLLDDYLTAAQQTDMALVAPADPATAATIGKIRRLATAAEDEGVATIGEFFLALVTPTSPAWASDELATLRTTPLEVLADPTMAPHYGWPDAMSTIFDGLSGPSRAAVLDTSVLRPGGHRTLEEVGQDHSLTRERIRQLRMKTCKRLGDESVIEAAARLLGGLLDPACPTAVLIDRGFDPADELVQILASVANHNGWLTGKIWSDSVAGQPWYGIGTKPCDWIADAVDRAGGAVSVADLDEAFNKSYHLADSALIHTLIGGSEDLRILDDRVIDWSGSLLDKAIQVLKIHGEPMTTEQLIDQVEPNSARSLEGQLLTERKNGTRVIWTIDRLWALPDWDVETYARGEDLIAQIIAEAGGRISLRRLTQIVLTRSNFSANSVQLWATMSPRFVCEDEVVRRRNIDEPIPVAKPWEQLAVVRRIDDPANGSWSTEIIVNYKSIRATSTSIPLPFATILGIEYDIDNQSVTVNDRRVSVSWGMNSLLLHSSGGWRKICESLGARDGDRLIFTATGVGTADARLATAAEEDASPTERIRSLIGGEGTNNILPDVASAIGLDGQLDVDFTLDDINARLARRRDNELRDALVAIHPELEV